MVRHYVLTLSGSAQRLSSVLPNLEPDNDKFLQTLSLQPGGGNANPVYVGAAGVSDSDYGVYLAAAAATVPPAPWLASDAFKATGTKLSDWYVIGTASQKLHILVVTQ